MAKVAELNDEELNKLMEEATGKSEETEEVIEDNNNEEETDDNVAEKKEKKEDKQEVDEEEEEEEVEEKEEKKPSKKEEEKEGDEDDGEEELQEQEEGQEVEKEDKEKELAIKRLKDKQAFLERQKKELDDLDKLTASEALDKIKELDKDIGSNARLIGTKRKELAKRQLDELEKKEKDITVALEDDDFYADPKKSVEKILDSKLEIKEQKNKAQLEYADALNTELMLETRDAVNDFEPAFEEKYVDEIIELVKQDVKDGKVKAELTPAMIQQFKNNPYTTDYNWLVKMIRRVDLTNKEKEVIKKSVSKQDVLEKMEKVAQRKPNINASNKQSKNITKRNIDKNKMDELSDEELDALLEEHNKEEEE